MQDKNTIKKVIKILAEQIGVDVEDIKPEDSFLDNLHMSPADLTDFSKKLETQGFDVSSIDLSQTKTLEELTEALGLESDI